MVEEKAANQSASGNYIAQALGEGAQAIVQVTHIHEAPEPPIPLQRPSQVEHFTGRKKELKQLLRNLQPGRVVTLCGPGGIGKTALAAEVIWTLAPSNKPPERFPDGIIFHSFYNQPQAALALEHIVRSFGEEPTPSPAIAAHRVLAQRQALLLLDGTENADNLGSVLGVHGNCGVLITSRRHQDAPSDWYDITPLSMTEAVTLLRAWGKTRAKHQDVVVEICQFVGRLPLAVRLVGRYLAQTAEEDVDYLAWLKQTPLIALDQGQRQEESVPLLLARSLAQISETAQSTLGIAGMLALAPFGRTAMSAALSLSESETGQILGELINYGFLLRDEASGLYRVSHALVHTYAHLQLSVEPEVIQQLTAYYISLAEKQNKAGAIGYERLDIEWPHLRNILETCLAWKDWIAVQRLVESLDDYLDMQGHWTERVSTLKIGLEAARKLHNREEEGILLNALGLVHNYLGDMQKAIEYGKQSLDIAREIKDRLSEAKCLFALCHPT